MKNSLCAPGLFAAVMLLFVSGFASAQGGIHDPSDPSPQRPSYSGETNSPAYAEIIVIPLLLFILMVGVVRTQKI